MITLNTFKLHVYYTNNGQLFLKAIALLWDEIAWGHEQLV